jgi:hypothetical protein
MARFQWSLRGMFKLLLFASIGLGAYVTFWSRTNPNANFLLAVFLLPLVTATLGAARGWPPIRRPCLGYAAFGWCYYVGVLKLAMPLQSVYDEERIAELSELGIPLGLLAAIAATWVMPPSKADDTTSRDAPRGTTATGE